MSKKLLVPFNDFYQLCRIFDKLLSMVNIPDEVTLLYVAPTIDENYLMDTELLYSQFKSLQARSCSQGMMLKLLIQDHSSYDAVLEFAQVHQMEMILFSAAFSDCFTAQGDHHPAMATSLMGQKEPELMNIAHHDH